MTFSSVAKGVESDGASVSSTKLVRTDFLTIIGTPDQARRAQDWELALNSALLQFRSNVSAPHIVALASGKGMAALYIRPDLGRFGSGRGCCPQGGRGRHDLLRSHFTLTFSPWYHTVAKSYSYCHIDGFRCIPSSRIHGDIRGGVVRRWGEA